MSITDVLEGDINIKDLSSETPKRNSDLPPFVTEEDWEMANHSIEGWNTVGDDHFYSVATSLKIVSPDRFNLRKLIDGESPDSQRELLKKDLLRAMINNSLRGNMNEWRAMHQLFQAGVLFPGDKKFEFDDEIWDRLRGVVEDSGDLSGGWISGSAWLKVGSGDRLRIQVPQENYQDFFSDCEGFDRGTSYRPDWVISHLAYSRLVTEDLFQKAYKKSMSPRMERVLATHRYNALGSGHWDTFMETAAAMRIIKAKEVKVSDRGLEIIDPIVPIEEVSTLPEGRKF